MTAGRELYLLVPGSLEQRTGGYLYNKRMVQGLRSQGWTVVVPSLQGRFPDPNPEAEVSMRNALATIPEHATVLVDSLALPALAGVPAPALTFRQIIALVHHLTSDETGFNTLTKNRLRHREGEAITRVSGVIVTSDYTAGRVTAMGVRRERIRVVVPGTEASLPAVGPRPDEPVLILCVGSVIPRKGQDVLVLALAQHLERRWRCVCAGSLEQDRAFSRSVRTLAAREGLGDRLRFVGQCGEDQLASLYARASIFVLPSHFEGYGMALTEALARGLPVISTTGGAIPDTVPKEAGILVPAGDPGALGEAIALLLEDVPEDPAGGLYSAKRRRAELSAGALRHAARLPDWEEQSRCFADALTLSAAARH